MQFGPILFKFTEQAVKQIGRNVLWIVFSALDKKLLHTKAVELALRTLNQKISMKEFSAADWRISPPELQGLTPLMMFINYAAENIRPAAWEALDALIESDTLDGACWDVNFEGITPLMKLLNVAIYGENPYAWGTLKKLVAKEVLTRAHWKVIRGKNRQFGFLVASALDGSRESWDIIESLVDQNIVDGEILHVILDDVNIPLNQPSPFLVILGDAAFNKDPRAWQVILKLVKQRVIDARHWNTSMECMRVNEHVQNKIALCQLLSEDFKANPCAREILTEVIAQNILNAQSWNSTVECGIEDMHGISALWMLLYAANKKEISHELFEQLVRQGHVTAQGCQVAPLSGVNKGRTVLWFLANSLQWKILHTLVDIADKQTWNWTDPLNTVSPLWHLAARINEEPEVCDTLIKLVDNGVLDASVLDSKGPTGSNSLKKAMLLSANKGNEKAAIFLAHCGIKGILSQDGEFNSWDFIKLTFVCLTRNDRQPSKIAEKFIQHYDALTEEVAAESPKMAMRIRANLYILYAQYLIRLHALPQALTALKTILTITKNAKRLVLLVVKMHTEIINQYAAQEDWFHAYQAAQAALEYCQAKEISAEDLKSKEAACAEYKLKYLTEILHTAKEKNAEFRWELTPAFSFTYSLTAMQMQGVCDGNLKLSRLFRNIEKRLEKETGTLTIIDPMKVNRALIATILSSNDGLFESRTPSPVLSVKSVCDAVSNMSVEDDIYKRRAPCVGKVKDALEPDFLQDDDPSSSDDEKLSLPSPSIALSAEEYFVPPIAVTSSSGFTKFLTVRNEVLLQCADLADFFVHSRRQVSLLRRDAVGKPGVRNGEVETEEGFQPMLLLKFCNKRGDATRAVATEIPPRGSCVYAVKSSSFDHKQEERLLKEGKMRLF